MIITIAILVHCFITRLTLTYQFDIFDGGQKATPVYRWLISSVESALSQQSTVIINWSHVRRLIISQLMHVKNVVIYERVNTA